MSELHEPITELSVELRVPEPRALPRTSRNAQLALLMTQIAEEREAHSVSRAARIAAHLRALGVRLGLLTLLLGACVLTSLAGAGNAQAAKTIEVTAATGAVTSVAAAMVRSERTSITLATIKHAQARRTSFLVAQPHP